MATEPIDIVAELISIPGAAVALARLQPSVRAAAGERLGLALLHPRRGRWFYVGRVLAGAKHGPQVRAKLYQLHAGGFVLDLMMVHARRLRGSTPVVTAIYPEGGGEG